MIIGLYVFHRSTNKPPYKVYPNTFQQRGDVLSEDRFPKTASDTLYLMRMEQLQKYDEITNELENNRIDYNGIIAACSLILGSLIGIGKLLMDMSDRKNLAQMQDIKDTVQTKHEYAFTQFDAIIKKLDDNTKQHEDIYVKLSVVEDITIRKNIAEQIKAIAHNHIHYHCNEIPDSLKLLIISQAERIIAFSNQIMNEKFSPNVLAEALIKIDEQSKLAKKQAIEIVDSNFYKFYNPLKVIAEKGFKERLSAIANDTEFNSKYDRYRRAAEWFADELIRSTITAYKKYKP